MFLFGNVVESAHNFSSHKDAKGLTAAMLVNLILVLIVFSRIEGQ